jgi:Peptidase S24-like
MSGQANHRRADVVPSLLAEMLRSFGEFRFVAWGSSMVPSIFPGDTLIVRRGTPEGARSGDVLLFFREGRFYAHRLVGKAEEGGLNRLVARGDAFSRNDPPYAENEMLGHVAAVIRGRKRIELDRHPRAGQRLLRSIVQRSASSVRWLLRWHSVRMRFGRNPSTVGSNVQWQLRESI